MFASNDACRYVICGVHIEITKDKVLVVATDGRRLFVMNATEEVSFIVHPEKDLSFIIANDLIAGMPKPEGKTLTLEYGEYRSKLTVNLCGVREVSHPAIEGNYPDWRRVVPNGNPVPMERMCLHPGLMDSFTKASSALSFKSGGVVIQQHTNNLGPLMIFPASTVANWFGVLMPIRSDDLKAPDWIK